MTELKVGDIVILNSSTISASVRIRRSALPSARQDEQRLDITAALRAETRRHFANQKGTDDAENAW